ncbi:hypothetical protein ABT174_20980 [Streptomyces sparsogenes]|uniref:WD40 repeat domain-containing protein n=1 Tax=Streptomyces sparsogenes TaxID=67365 RepID=UPI003325F40B
MTDPDHEDGVCAEPAATWAAGAGMEWRVEWATGGLIDGAAGAVGHADWVRSAATTVVDGRAVAVTGDDEAVLVWDLATGERMGDALPARGSVWALATAVVDGRPVAVVAGPDTSAQSWDLTGHQLLAGLVGGAWTAATAVVEGRPVVLTGGSAPALQMWDPATGERFGDLVGDPLTGRVGAVVTVVTAVVDGHPKGITLHDDSTVHLWDLTERRHQGGVLPPTGGSRQRVSLTAAVVEGRLVAVTGSWDGRVQVWDMATRTEVTGRAPLTPHTGPVWAVATASVDGRPLVVTGGDDRTVRVRDLVSHRQVGSDLVFPSEVTAVTMVPDGRLVVGFGGNIAVLAPPPPLTTRSTPATGDTSARHGSQVNVNRRCAVDPDGPKRAGRPLWARPENGADTVGVMGAEETTPEPAILMQRGLTSLGEVACRYQADEIRPEDLPQIAAEALAAGLDTPTLRELAGWPRNAAPRDIRDAFEQTLDESGIELPDRDLARRHALRRLAARLIDGEIAPADLTTDHWWETEAETAAERSFVALIPQCECCIEYTLGLDQQAWAAQLRIAALALTSSPPIGPGC